MSHFHDPYRPSARRSGDAPKAVAPEPVDEAKAVPAGTSREVLAWVDGDSEKARLALAAEESDASPRKGLVKELNELIAEDDATK